MNPASPQPHSPSHRSSSVTIPLTPLGAELTEAARIQQYMATLLHELEESATGHAVAAKPGGWRHHPAAWAKAHDPTERPT